MRFSVAAILAFAASALAQNPTKDFDPVFKPEMNEVVAAGKSFTITWDAISKYADGTISIELIGGATQPTQQHIDNIASGIKNKDNSYTWNVRSDLGAEKVYGLVLRLESDPKIFQFSNPFQIKGSDNKPTGSDTVTMTKSHGIKTVTLSSSTTTTSCTTTAAASTSSASASSASSKTKHHSTTAIANSTTTLVQSTTTQSTSVGVPTTAPNAPATTSTTSTTSSVVSPTPTAAASAVRVGSLTIFGVVAALLVL